MSTWTHIVAAIDVDTYIEDKNIKSVVEELLKESPKITGSEGNANVFVNVLSGYNHSTNCDCKNCEYLNTIQKTKDGFICDSPDGYDCHEGKYQTRVVITVIGDLRDRYKSMTHKEWNKFNNFVAKKIYGKRGFEIRNCACIIRGW